MKKLRIGIACELSGNSGEGVLARSFFGHHGICADNSDCEIYTPIERLQHLAKSQAFVKRKFATFSIYIWLLLLVLRLRCLKQGQLYIANFVPLWNFLFFILVPKNAVIGPVTGSGVVNLNHFFGSYLQKLNIYILRNKICILLNKISSVVIKARKLNVKPATPFVSVYTNGKLSKYLFVVACLDVDKITKAQFDENLAESDVLIYTNQHILKNNDLIYNVVELLSKEGFSCAILGDARPKISGVNNIGITDRENALSIIKKSKIILSCSLEGAGFFPSEAALLDKKILCFPDTGASFLPGAVSICGKNHKVTAEDIVRLVEREIEPLNEGCIQNEMKILIEETRNFYDFGER